MSAVQLMFPALPTRYRNEYDRLKVTDTLPLVSVSLLGTFCLQIPGPDSCVHLRLPGNSNCTQVTALSNFPETQVLAPDGPEDAIPWPETLAEALGELNSMGPFETGTEKQGHRWRPGGYVRNRRENTFPM